VPAGLPAIAFGPAVATLDYDDTILPLAVNTHQFKLSADFPVGSHHTEEFRQAIAFTQDGNGVVTIHGLTPHLDPSMPVEALTPPVGGLSLSGIPTTGHYAVNSTMPTLGNLTGSGDFVANEDVSTAVGTFATSRLAGSGTLDAFTVNITAWLNPQVGAFVKLRVQWTEGDGSTMDMTFQLTSTTVAYVP